MKKVLLSAGDRAALWLVLAVMVLASACSKHADDCPAPDNADEQTATRAYAAGHGQDILNDRPGGFTQRGSEEIEGDTDGDGISDDGDDEADGEGNKKVRPAQ
jgi:hypothetical protein